MAEERRPASDEPLIAESSRFFMVVAAATLLVAGLAGVVNDPSDHAADAVPAAAASDPETSTGGHEHPDAASEHPATGRNAGAADHHEAGPHAVAATHPGEAAGQTSDAETEAHDHSGNGVVTSASDRENTADHADHGGGGASDNDAGHADHADHPAEPGGSSDDEGHGAHAEAHAACSDDHPATQALVEKVRFGLTEMYTDVATLFAKGFIPYFDAFVPGGYPPGGEGISHWIRPQYIDDGVMLDPLRPETILLDDWWRPIGMMFIADPGDSPPPVYVNDDGTPCSPWHPHTDMPARFGWWFYRMVYDDAAAEGDMGLPERTPAMMHVWAVDTPHGVYAAHDYPPPESREGPPGPMPSYFEGGTVEEQFGEVFGQSR